MQPFIHFEATRRMRRCFAMGLLILVGISCGSHCIAQDVDQIVGPIDNRWTMTPVPPAKSWLNPPRDSASQPRFKLRGRIDSDFIWSNQSDANRETYGDLGDIVGLRRARIGAEGHLSPDSRYVGEIDLAAGIVVIRDLYFATGNVQRTGETKFGHMREPFSLEGGTSANSFAFMERSPINMLDPARNWGIGYTRAAADESWTFSGGVFQGGTDASDIQYGPGSTSALTTRVTGLAWYENQGRDLMHFGLALSERIPDQGVITINQQPQSPLLNFGDSSISPFVPKLTIPASYQQLINTQWAYVHDSLWIQAEWYGSLIDQTSGGGLVFFHGSYIDAGYFLTGEHRSYLTKSGIFGPVSVKRPVISHFSSKSHEEVLGYGAWEATLRVSYLDFIDSDLPSGPDGQALGVELPLATVGMNWYLADRLRLMFNYSYAAPNEANTGTSSVSVFSMRIGMFW